MAIGEIVKNNIRAIVNYCNQNPDEIDRLCDGAYSKAEFGLSPRYPFFIEVDNITEANKRRFYTPVYTVNNRRVRVSSQWYENQTYRFLHYLQSKRIAVQGAIAENENRGVQENNHVAAMPVENHRPANTRWDLHAIGNAQNSFIRYLLGSIGCNSFKKQDWENARTEQFQNQCAYCGCELTSVVIDHAVPINRVSLGEHKLGNLIPSCNACNSAKRDKDYREFLEEKYADDVENGEQRIRRIEEFMLDHDYLPLTGNEKIRKILAMAHEDVKKISERYVEIINNLIEV